MKTRHCALWKKLLIAALILAVLCAAIAGGLSLWVWGQARGYLLSQEEAAALSDVDAILVLGCGVRPDGTPSLMLQDRLEMGLTLYEAGAAPKLLMSGDHSRAEYDEVNAMKDYVVERGVPSEDVFLDHAGFSTYESMYRARDVFRPRRSSSSPSGTTSTAPSTMPAPWAWTPTASPPRTSPTPASSSGKPGRFWRGTRTFSTVFSSLFPLFWVRPFPSAATATPPPADD